MRGESTFGYNLKCGTIVETNIKITQSKSDLQI